MCTVFESIRDHEEISNNRVKLIHNSVTFVINSLYESSKITVNGFFRETSYHLNHKNGKDEYEIVIFLSDTSYDVEVSKIGNDKKSTVAEWTVYANGVIKETKLCSYKNRQEYARWILRMIRDSFAYQKVDAHYHGGL